MFFDESDINHSKGDIHIQIAFSNDDVRLICTVSRL